LRADVIAGITLAAYLMPAGLADASFGSRLVEMPQGDINLALAHYQAGFKPLLYGIIAALILTFFLKETRRRVS
jgi:MFS superfamily sulfate permease-like transporter